MKFLNKENALHFIFLSINLKIIEQFLDKFIAIKNLKLLPKMNQQNDENNKNEMVEKMEVNSNSMEMKKFTSIQTRPLPVELLNELFTAMPLENALEILAKMPNFVLPRIVRKMLKSIEMAMKANKWNLEDCGPGMSITGDGLEVKHSGVDGINICVRAELPIPKFKFTAKSIAYFEVEIVKKDPDWNCAIGIGFCGKQFPLEGNWLGLEKNSIGIWYKSELYIGGGQPTKFGKDNGDFKVGDIIGMGIIKKAANSPMKCFVSCNGKLTGMFELPAKFTTLQVFPAVNICSSGDSIRANFGQNEWRFNPI